MPKELHFMRIQNRRFNNYNHSSDQKSVMKTTFLKDNYIALKSRKYGNIPIFYHTNESVG